MKKKFISYPIYSRQKLNKNEQNVNIKIKQTFNIKSNSNNTNILQNRIFSQRQRLPSIQRMLDKNPSRKQSIHNLRTSIQVKKAQFSNQKALKTINTNKISSNIQIKQSLNTIKSDKNLNLNSFIERKVNQTLQNEEKNQIFNTKINTKKVIVAKNRKEFSKLNQQLIYDIRQNVLNSNYQKRKNRLNIITKQNKKIHQRINSQKSSYSNRDLNKSYQSSASISKRLSNSKISRNSRISNRSNNSSQCSIRSIDKIRHKPNKQVIKVQQRNIKDLQKDQIKNLALLFNQKCLGNQMCHKSCRPSKTIQYKQKQSHKQNKVAFQTISQLPKLKQIKRLIDTPQKGRIRTARILSTINQNLMESTNNKQFLNQIIEYPYHNQSHQNKLNNIDRNSLIKKMIF